MTIQGKLHAKFDTQEVSERCRKREFVIEYVENPMYPQHVLFQLVQDKVSLVDSMEIGTMLEVDFNLRGRSWTSPQNEVRYFNSLEAWRIKPVQVGATGGQESAPPPPPPDAIDASTDLEEDDLPF